MVIGRAAILVLVLAAVTASPLRAQDAAGARADVEVATAPVEVDGETLFYVRGLSSFPAVTRAEAIRDRIVAIAADASVPVDSLRVMDDAGVARIVAGDRPIMAVVDADAALEQVSRANLATAQLFRLKNAITSYRSARSPEALQRAALDTGLATIVLVLAVVALVWLWRLLDRLLTRRLHIHSVGIQSFELMRADRILAALHRALLGARAVVLLAVALVYLGYVFGLWPWTRGLAGHMTGFALAPLQVIVRGFVAHIPGLVFLTVLYFVVRLTLRLTRLFFDAVQGGAVVLAGFDADWAQPTYKIIRIIVVAFALVVGYPYIPGSESEAFKGVSIFLGIVFSLGSSSAISNIIAGYTMTYRRAFKVGDRVKIGDSVGEVVETRLQVTHLRSPKNEEIVIPNSHILSTDVVNYSTLARAHGLILHTEVGIGYEVPWRQVEAMLLTAAERTPGLSLEPRPFVLLKALGDFAVTYELNAYLHDVKEMFRLYAALHRNILDQFNEYGVQIMTPAYESDPEELKVVPRAKWYAAPAVPPDVPAARSG